MLMWIKDHMNSTVESCGQGNQSFQRLVHLELVQIKKCTNELEDLKVQKRVKTPLNV